MLERLKQALVESFVGAIALGLLLSQAIGHMATSVSSQLTNWLLQDQYHAYRPMPPGYPLQNAIPELVRFLVLLLVGYLLLRWLYYKPVEGTIEPEPDDQTDK